MTLIEVIVAIVLVVGVMGVMLWTFVMGKVMATQAEHRVQAANILRAEIDKVKAGDFEAIISYDYQPILIDNKGTSSGDDDVTGMIRCVVQYETEGGQVLWPNSKIVTLSLQWDEAVWGVPGGRTVEESIQTRIAEY